MTESRKVRKALIMVGGKGTRLLPLTGTKPKPILEVADKPCMWYLLRSLAKAGIEEVVLGCGYRSEAMKQAIGDGSDLGMTITYSYEDEPLGTSGAMKLAEDLLDDTFVACNGDVFADIDIAAEIREHFRSGASVTMALTPVENPCEFGIACVADDGRITEFKEKPKPEEVFSNLINAGVYIVDRSVLQYVPENQFHDFSKDLVPFLMEKGYRIQGYRLDGLWMDVGRPHDLLASNQAVAEREYGQTEWGCVDTTVEGPFYMGPGSTVRGCSCVSSVIQAGSHIEDCQLENVLIMPNCTVVGSRISNAIIGEGTTIGKGSRIENVVLGEDTVIGKDTELNGGRVV